MNSLAAASADVCDALLKILTVQQLRHTLLSCMGEAGVCSAGGIAR